jgi:3D (Asp-Asp-Asp) domain-containing protein
MKSRIYRRANGAHELKTDQIIVCVLVVLAILLYAHSMHINVRMERARTELAQMEIRLQEITDQNEVMQAMVSDLFGTMSVQTMEITFYAPLDPQAKEGMCFSGDRTVTASGAPVVIGETISAARSVPFGTRVWIDGFGWREVTDRGGKITDGRLDIAVDTVEEAMRLGRQKTLVLIAE